MQREVGFKGCPASIQISGVGYGNTKRNQKYSTKSSKEIYGSLAEFLPYGGNKITGDAMGIDLLKAENTFSAVAQDLESPESPIHLLIGMEHMDDAPREQERGKNLVLYRSILGRLYGMWEHA
jgi:hypothetical protein